MDAFSEPAFAGQLMETPLSEGYSQTPLIRKLGIQAGDRVLVLNAPEGFALTLGELLSGCKLLKLRANNLDFIHCFTRSQSELRNELSSLQQRL